MSKTMFNLFGLLSLFLSCFSYAEAVRLASPSEIHQIIQRLPEEMQSRFKSVRVENKKPSQDFFMEINQRFFACVFLDSDQVLHLQFSENFLLADAVEIGALTALTEVEKIFLTQEIIKALDMGSQQARVTQILLECQNQSNQMSVQSCEDAAMQIQGLYSQNQFFKNIYAIYATQKPYLVGLRNNPTSYFSVHLSNLIYDPKYSCEYPAMTLTLLQMFPSLTEQVKVCEDVKFNFWNNNGADVIHLNSVKKIEVVKVASGSGMSAWGHIMFNLVICKKFVDDQCATDDLKNLVFSIHEEKNVAMPVASGAFGFSRLVGAFMTLKEAYYGYTVGENRELKAYELNFSDLEKKKFVAIATEINHRGFGHWQHVFKNCTTTAAALLNLSIAENKEDSIFAILPVKLEHTLRLFSKSSREPLIKSVRIIGKDHL